MNLLRANGTLSTSRWRSDTNVMCPRSTSQVFPGSARQRSAQRRPCFKRPQASRSNTHQHVAQINVDHQSDGSVGVNSLLMCVQTTTFQCLNSLHQVIVHFLTRCSQNSQIVNIDMEESPWVSITGVRRTSPFKWTWNDTTTVIPENFCFLKVSNNPHRHFNRFLTEK